MEKAYLLKNFSLDDQYLLILCHYINSFISACDLLIANAQGSVVYYLKLSMVFIWDNKVFRDCELRAQEEHFFFYIVDDRFVIYIFDDLVYKCGNLLCLRLFHPTCCNSRCSYAQAAWVGGRSGIAGDGVVVGDYPGAVECLRELSAGDIFISQVD